jgi:hypothetical protein
VEALATVSENLDGSLVPASMAYHIMARSSFADGTLCAVCCYMDRERRLT